MANPIDFYFDYSSPYGYIAAMKIDDLAARHARIVNWKPILLGAVFKVTGAQPLPSLPLKGDYARRDIARSARFHGIRINHPSKFPIATQAPARAFYWLNDRDPALARKLAKILYQAYFVEDRDISSPEVTAGVAATLGLKRDEVLAAMAEPAIKERVRTETDAAIKLGVFGSPYIVIDGESFWGVDRFDQIERWLAQGPF
ncbi:MAG: 2-hydroxychromene-2-carboxylate isomerase [Betaproteobacteria bacterium]|nr:2-hydroxychromene-2-carboxylate isomerase [Betaproteobacteria bacterium]